MAECPPLHSQRRLQLHPAQLISGNFPPIDHHHRNGMLILLKIPRLILNIPHLKLKLPLPPHRQNHLLHRLAKMTPRLAIQNHVTHRTSPNPNPSLSLTPLPNLNLNLNPNPSAVSRDRTTGRSGCAGHIRHSRTYRERLRLRIKIRKSPRYLVRLAGMRPATGGPASPVSRQPFHALPPRD